MLSVERKDIIRDIILEKKSATVTELAEKFDVSQETIRRDFDALEKEGILIKTYGGATIRKAVSTTVSTRQKANLFIENKQSLAAEAAKFVHPNDVIFLDHSSTVSHLCEFIDKLPLTVITNSMYVINHLSQLKNISLVVPGGLYSIRYDGFFGIETVRFLQSHNCDRSFLSCDGLGIKRGICNGEEQVSELRKSIIDSSEESYLLVDHTKFKRNAFISTCDFSCVTKIITDLPLDDEYTDFFSENNISCTETYTAKSAGSSQKAE